MKTPDGKLPKRKLGFKIDEPTKLENKKTGFEYGLMQYSFIDDYQYTSGVSVGPRTKLKK